MGISLCYNKLTVTGGAGDELEETVDVGILFLSAGKSLSEVFDGAWRRRAKWREGNKLLSLSGPCYFYPKGFMSVPPDVI